MTGDVDMLVLAPPSCGDVDPAQLLHDLVTALTDEVTSTPSLHLLMLCPFHTDLQAPAQCPLELACPAAILRWRKAQTAPIGANCSPC